MIFKVSFVFIAIFCNAMAAVLVQSSVEPSVEPSVGASEPPAPLLVEPSVVPTIEGIDGLALTPETEVTHKNSSAPHLLFVTLVIPIDNSQKPQGPIKISTFANKGGFTRGIRKGARDSLVAGIGDFISNALSNLFGIN